MIYYLYDLLIIKYQNKCLKILLFKLLTHILKMDIKKYVQFQKI